jgi:hypothetical protein
MIIVGRAEKPLQSAARAPCLRVRCACGSEYVTIAWPCDLRDRVCRACSKKAAARSKGRFITTPPAETRAA